MPGADYLKLEVLSHAQRVCRLYKKMRIDTIYQERDYFEAKYKQLEIRREFDKRKNIKDMRVAKAILKEAEKDFYENTIHPNHKQNLQALHPFSKTGISYGREEKFNDYFLDFYHPLEKAQYPYFFEKREKMKDEYLRLWNKKVLGKPDTEPVETDQEKH